MKLDTVTGATYPSGGMKASENRYSLWRSIQPPGSATASPALVFIAVSAVMALQVALNLAMGIRWLSVSILINQLLFVAGVPILIIRIWGLDTGRLVRIGGFEWRMFFLLIVFMFGACVLVDYATVLSESIWPISEAARQAIEGMMRARGAAQVAWKLFLLCVVPGVCEEIFFRGFCQTSLEARWGTARAVIATSLIFALMHGILQYMHLYFLLGLVFGWAYAATGSLWAPILCHVLNNAWTFVNHLRGFEFPIGESFSYADAGFAVLAALVVVAAMRSIKRRGLAIRARLSSPSRPDFKVE